MTQVVRFLGNLALVELFIVATTCVGLSQPALDRPIDSNNKAGQLFTVKIVPGAKLIDIFVAGNETAKVDFSGVDMVATLKIGNKSWNLTPVRSGDRYSIASPADASISRQRNQKASLELLLKQGQKTETFRFDLKP